jgi:hypothetical protein
MHQPGYIQGGQEVGRDYLLLGIHYRRIRSALHNLSIKVMPHLFSISLLCGINEQHDGRN